MSSFFNKYKKYKIKYINLKEKNEKDIYNLLNTNLMDGLLNLDFMHDNSLKLVKGKIFYDMINGKQINITNLTFPKEIENIIHKYFIDLANNNKSVFNDKFELTNEKIRIDDLKDFIAIYDVSTDNLEMKKKLKNIFNITKERKTFIGNCEKMLKIKTKIDDEFLINDNLKEYYLLEAIKIGFLPISKDYLLNFNIFTKNDVSDIKLFEEYLKLILYINETLVILKNNKILKKQLPKKFIQELKYIKKVHIKKNIKKCQDLKKIYIDDSNDMIPFKSLIIKIVLSLKEARDIYYIEEIKNMPNDKYILISGDLIQSFRALLENISCINVMMSIIRFLGLYYNDKLNIIGNPFELFSSDNETIKIYQENTMKKILRGILRNPILQFKKKNISVKYLINSHDIINKKFWIKCGNIFKDDDELDYEIKNIREILDYPDECSKIENLNEKKNILDILIKFGENNIDTKEDLIFILNKLNEKNDFIFLEIIKQIKKNNIFNNRSQKLYIYVLLITVTVYKSFCFSSYMLPLIKYLYPSYFNYKEIEEVF